MLTYELGHRQPSITNPAPFSHRQFGAVRAQGLQKPQGIEFISGCHTGMDQVIPPPAAGITYFCSPFLPIRIAPVW